MRSRLGRLHITKALQKGLADSGEPRLIRLIVAVSGGHCHLHQGLIWLFIVGFLELRPGTEKAYQQHLAPVVQAITDYLGHSVETGTLPVGIIHLATTAVAATVLAHQGLHPLLKGTQRAYAGTDEATTAYSQFWLNALTAMNTSELAAKRGSGR